MLPKTKNQVPVLEMPGWLADLQSQPKSVIETRLLLWPPTRWSEVYDTSNLEMRVLLIKCMTSIFHSAFP